MKSKVRVIYCGSNMLIHLGKLPQPGRNQLFQIAKLAPGYKKNRAALLKLLFNLQGPKHNPTVAVF